MDNIGTKMHGDPKTDEAYFQKASASAMQTRSRRRC